MKINIDKNEFKTILECMSFALETNIDITGKKVMFYAFVNPRLVKVSFVCDDLENTDKIKFTFKTRDILNQIKKFKNTVTMTIDNSQFLLSENNMEYINGQLDVEQALTEPNIEFEYKLKLPPEEILEEIDKCSVVSENIRFNDSSEGLLLIQGTKDGNIKYNNKTTIKADTKIDSIFSIKLIKPLINKSLKDMILNLKVNNPIKIEAKINDKDYVAYLGPIIENN